MLDRIPNIDNKKYDEILLSYSFSSELIPIAMKYDDNRGVFYIIYSSSKGNFIVELSTRIKSIKNGKKDYDKEWINGINYLKEIK